MTTDLCFIDTETTSLDPDTGEIWEVALISRLDDTEKEYTWQLPVDLTYADPMALKVSEFHHRRLPRGQWTPLTQFAHQFVDLTLGSHLVGAVVSFDTERLWKLLRSLGQCPMWHYHVIDVEAMAVGWVHGRYGTRDRAERDAVGLPWNSEELSSAVGVDPSRFDRHTALGDAQWARAIYDAITV